MIFSLGSKKYTIVDIGASAVKVIVMKNNNKNVELLSADYSSLPPGIIKDDEIYDKSIVVNRMEEIFEKISHTPKNIITCIPSNHLITRNIELPALEDEELNEAIKWELDDVLPYSANKTTFDYIVTDRNDDSINVLSVAVKDKMIEQFKEPFLDLGLNPEVINVQPMALISLLNFQNKLTSPSSIIDIGHQGTRVILADNNNLHLTRTIDRGGEDFTNNIMEKHQYEYKKAEEYKCKNGIENELDNSNPLDSVEDDLSLLGIGNDQLNIAKEISQEISRSLEFYSIKNRGESIKNVYLTGGSAYLKGLIDVISEEIGQTPILLDPLEGFENKSTIPENKSHIYTIALGLGASEVLHHEG